VLAASVGLALLVACTDDSGSSSGATADHTSSTDASTPEPADVLAILPLGDSITQGSGFVCDPEYASYRRYLAELLEPSSFDFVGSVTDPCAALLGYPARHEGHSGWTIDDVLPEVEGWVGATAPDVILIHLGTNDLSDADPIDEDARQLRRVVELALGAAPDAAVLVAEIVPVPARPDDVVRFNDAVMAGLADLDVTVVDLHTDFDEAWIPDGLHPDAEGQRFMARRWYEALVAGGLVTDE